MHHPSFHAFCPPPFLHSPPSFSPPYILPFLRPSFLPVGLPSSPPLLSPFLPSFFTTFPHRAGTNACPFWTS
jgi:hypothetical protein